MAVATPGNAAGAAGATPARWQRRDLAHLLGGRIHRVHGIRRGLRGAGLGRGVLVRTGGQRLHNLLVKRCGLHTQPLITSSNFTTARRSVVTDRQPESVGIAF
jgi:hypothetical protein